jgi:hypothetical protein
MGPHEFSPAHRFPPESLEGDRPNRYSLIHVKDSGPGGGKSSVDSASQSVTICEVRVQEPKSASLPTARRRFKTRFMLSEREHARGYVATDLAAWLLLSA